MKCYLVGGAVRDQLLGYPHSEHDWVVVGATPEEMLAAGFKPVGKDFPVFLHPHTNEEYALARTERKAGRGYHGFVCHSSPDVTLEEDLERRDLTINAMALGEDGQLIDPYGGREDLEQRWLRHVSPAFVEDPLRVLRVARFAARYHHLGFRIADPTWDLMREIVASGEIDHLVAERVWKELTRALLEPNPEVFFQVLGHCGALAHLLPELAGHATAITWEALMRSAERNQPATVRFATLAAELDVEQTRRLCDRIKSPNQFRELAQLVSTHWAALKADISPQTAFALLENGDAFRRPERFEQFLATGSLLPTEAKSVDYLRRAQLVANGISPQPLLARGIKGKALGEALRQERLNAVQEMKAQ